VNRAAVNGHVIVVDLGFGDAGKGSIVDFLCAASQRGTRPVRAVVRFNGGAQAAHHVLAPAGQPHAFAQFGSGTFTPGTRTFLSRFMLVDPLALVAEAEQLRQLGVPDPFGLIAIDRDALLTTPYHAAVNRAREAERGPRQRHGSCGMGIGETARYALACPRDAPRAADMTSPRVLERKLTVLRDRLVSELASRPVELPPPADVAAVYRAVAGRVTLAGDGYLARLLRAGPVVFEGAQGVLLDEWCGFHPYTTWSTTTFENAETLLAETGSPAAATRLGVTRTYQTRHGPGPFPTEDPTLDLPEPHNADGRWQGPFRTGHLDAVALGYARAVAGGVDAVAVTHLDTARRHAGTLNICTGYEIDGTRRAEIEPGRPRDLAYQEALSATLLTARPVYAGDPPRCESDWLDVIAAVARAPVAIGSYGPRAADKSPANTGVPSR
jgi:adenylosuccinate synthase